MSLSLFLQVFQYPKASLSIEKVLPMHQSSINGVEDMSMLGDLHEAAILLNLHQRYQQGNIYVSAELGHGNNVLFIFGAATLHGKH